MSIQDGSRDHSAADEFDFDGAAVSFRPGQTIGAAMVAHGITSWRTTRVQARPRGLFCGIGICFDCLVSVDGQRSQRACLTQACAGQKVVSEDSVTPLNDVEFEDEDD